MNAFLKVKRLKLFAWIGLVYLALWVLHDFVTYPDTFPQRLPNELWRIVYTVAVNYVFFEIVVSFLNRKRILWSFLALVGQFLLFSLGAYAWREIGIAVQVWTPLKTFPSLRDAVCDQFTGSIMSVIFFGIVRHVYDFIELRQAAQQLRIEKQEAELNYLKSQTNPHFLFNTLNNIYSLAQDKSDLAPESILRLSKILRFMLYETGGDFIAIEDELRIINDYIALEKLRYDDSLEVDFQYEIHDPQQQLPPLLLIPLVENAFKHGVSETRKRPFVDIRLSASRRELAFSIRNSSEKPPEERRVKENIGLSNLRRQLELLYTDYELSVQQGEAVFTTQLKINLASHV